MQLDDLDLVWCDASLLVDFLRGASGHVSSNQVDGTTSESDISVRLQRDSKDLNCLVFKLVGLDEGFGAQDGGSCSVGGGTALQLG